MTYIRGDCRKRMYIWCQSVWCHQFIFLYNKLNERHGMPHSKMKEINHVLSVDCLKKAVAAGLTLITSFPGQKAAHFFEYQFPCDVWFMLLAMQFYQDLGHTSTRIRVGTGFKVPVSRFSSILIQHPIQRGASHYVILMLGYNVHTLCFSLSRPCTLHWT